MFQWGENWRGYVEMTVEGPRLEEFINQCVAKDLPLMNIRRTSKGKTLTTTVRIADVKNVRMIAKSMGIKLRFGKRSSSYRIRKNSRKRFGFVSGIFLFCLLLFMLSQMVWRVDIEGASPSLELEVREWAEMEGLSSGQFQWRLPPEAELQQRVTEEVPGATWIGVERRGTTYQFHVVEQHLADEEAPREPGHIVASKKGVIKDIYVEHGQAVVSVNDVVDKGELLISGEIGREEEEEIGATGEVRAETWYQAAVELPVNITRHSYTGREEKAFVLQLFGHSWKLWGRDAASSFSHAHESQEQLEIPLYFAKVQLPIEQTTYAETQLIEKKYSLQELSEIAVKMGHRHLLRELGDDAEIIAENILQKQTDNGKVKLSIHYQVVEDIALEAPIKQGD